jgi:acetyl-CoA C-acetyltransferase
LLYPRQYKKAGLELKDIDYVELNEAFSVVGIVNARQMNLDPARINVTLINILQKRGGKTGAAGICNGGGGASAMVIESI